MSIKLEEFLSELIDRVRNDNISPEIRKSLTDLFLLNELEKVGKTPQMLLEEKDMKYYTIGWFVYNVLESEKKTL